MTDTAPTPRAGPTRRFVGVSLTLVVLHALNALARVFGLLTASLLGVGRSARASEPTRD